MPIILALGRIEFEAILVYNVIPCQENIWFRILWNSPRSHSTNHLVINGWKAKASMLKKNDCFRHWHLENRTMDSRKACCSRLLDFIYATLKSQYISIHIFLRVNIYICCFIYIIYKENVYIDTYINVLYMYVKWKWGWVLGSCPTSQHLRY